MSYKVDGQSCLTSKHTKKYIALAETWEGTAAIAKRSEVRARIKGVPSKMKELDFLFSLILGEKLLKHSDNLSRTIQATSTPAVEAR